MKDMKTSTFVKINFKFIKILLKHWKNTLQWLSKMIIKTGTKMINTEKLPNFYWLIKLIMEPNIFSLMTMLMMMKTVSSMLEMWFQKKSYPTTKWKIDMLLKLNLIELFLNQIISLKWLRWQNNQEMMKLKRLNLVWMIQMRN